jgi:Flp pilus assembly pilin Flp
MASIGPNQFRSVKGSEKGASLVEYALLVALIAVVAIVSVRLLGQTVSRQFSSLNASMR